MARGSCRRGCEYARGRRRRIGSHGSALDDVASQEDRVVLGGVFEGDGGLAWSGCAQPLGWLGCVGEMVTLFASTVEGSVSWL